MRKSPCFGSPIWVYFTSKALSNAFLMLIWSSGSRFTSSSRWRGSTTFSPWVAVSTRNVERRMYRGGEGRRTIRVGDSKCSALVELVSLGVNISSVCNIGLSSLLGVSKLSAHQGDQIGGSLVVIKQAQCRDEEDTADDNQNRDQNGHSFCDEVLDMAHCIRSQQAGKN